MPRQHWLCARGMHPQVGGDETGEYGCTENTVLLGMQDSLLCRAEEKE